MPYVALVELLSNAKAEFQIDEAVSVHLTWGTEKREGVICRYRRRKGGEDSYRFARSQISFKGYVFQYLAEGEMIVKDKFDPVREAQTRGQQTVVTVRITRPSVLTGIDNIYYGLLLNAYPVTAIICGV